MLSQMIINILVDRIRNGGMNPATGEVMVIDDIKDPTYKEAVQTELDKAV
jgi:hypothetical protein